MRGVPGPSYLRPGSGIDCGDGYFALNLSGSSLVFAAVDMHYVGAIAKASCVCTRGSGWAGDVHDSGLLRRLA